MFYKTSILQRVCLGKIFYICLQKIKKKFNKKGLNVKFLKLKSPKVGSLYVTSPNTESPNTDLGNSSLLRLLIRPHYNFIKIYILFYVFFKGVNIGFRTLHTNIRKCIVILYFTLTWTAIFCNGGSYSKITFKWYFPVYLLSIWKFFFI